MIKDQVENYQTCSRMDVYRIPLRGTGGMVVALRPQPGDDRKNPGLFADHEESRRRPALDKNLSSNISNKY